MTTPTFSRGATDIRRGGLILVASSVLQIVIFIINVTYHRLQC